MVDYTCKHKPDPKWTPNLNALIEFMPAGVQAQAAASELTKLKALAALAEEVAERRVGVERGYDIERKATVGEDWLRRFDAITKDGGLGKRSREGRHA